MVFSSLIFLILFLPILLVIYYLIPSKKTFAWKNIILLIFSLIFYAWGEPIYILLMLFSSIVDYTIGNLIDKVPKKKKIWLILSIVINLGMLMYFKYTNFFIDNINNIFNLSIDFLEITLPIGISFFTFQAISYVVDVYKKDTKASKSFLDFATYLSLFPQLIAGPIVRYSDVELQLNNREHTKEKFAKITKNSTYRRKIFLIIILF